MSSGQPNRVIAAGDVRAHFHECIDEALARQGVQAAQETADYLVELMTAFVHTEQLFDRDYEGRSHKPLAVLYAEALEGGDGMRRYQAMRRLGDMALFVAGVFTESIRRKVVDVDYYIAMGGNAYSYLSRHAAAATRRRSPQRVFGELAAKFANFVEVLNEVSEGANVGNQPDLMALYERWQRTGSRNSAARLRRVGIVPVRGGGRRSH